jgi:hypothetical protein
LLQIRFLSRQLIVLTQPAPAIHDHLPRRLPRLLAEDVDDYDCVVVEAIGNPPCRTFVNDAQFMAPIPASVANAAERASHRPGFGVFPSVA